MSDMGSALGVRLPVYVVDAFTASPFGGNPAAVCLLDPGVYLPDEARQRIAAEMNHSETAFVEPLEGGAPAEEGAAGAGADVFATSSHFRLRWFTPTTEVPCCGHATLASAAVLMAARGNPHAAISFHTLSGELTVSRAPPGSAAAAFALADAGATGTPRTSVTATTTATATTSHNPDGDRSADGGDRSATATAAAPPPPLVLSLSLPLYDPVDPLPPCCSAAAAAAAGPDEMAPLLAACVESGLPVSDVAYCEGGGLRYLLVVLGPGVGRRELEALRPDFGAMLAAAGEEEVHGVIVSARAEPEGDTAGSDPAGAGGAPEVLSRFFGPWMGINEDPVTGSAHAVLGPYWERKLRPGAHTAAAGAGGCGGGSGDDVTPMRMRQCSARGGNLGVEVLWREGRVRVSGAACLVLEGVLRL